MFWPLSKLPLQSESSICHLSLRIIRLQTVLGKYKRLRGRNVCVTKFYISEWKPWSFILFWNEKENSGDTKQTSWRNMLGAHLWPPLPPVELLGQSGLLQSFSGFWRPRLSQHVSLIPTISTLYRGSVSSAIGAINMIPALYFTDRKHELVLGMWGIFNH